MRLFDWFDEWMSHRNLKRYNREQCVLDALGDRPDGWGVNDLSLRVGIGVVRLHSMLARLEQDGYVTSWWQDGPYPRRRLYGRSL